MLDIGRDEQGGARVGPGCEFSGPAVVLEGAEDELLVLEI